jgi:DNA-binding response OmpR family regulator
VTADDPTGLCPNRDSRTIEAKGGVAANDHAAHGSVLLAEDDEALAALLSQVLLAGGYESVVVHDGLAALEVEEPIAAILDVNLPGMSGYQVCDFLRRTRGPDLPIVFISGERTESFDRVAGLLLGAEDYIAKPFDPGELLVRLVALLDRRAVPAGPERGLTEREHEVLVLLAEGLRQNQIADRLVISTNTVGTHIEHILGKLGVNSRAQAVAAAYRESLVP